jgi:pyrimidine-nucleoside phosphorylase
MGLKLTPYEVIRKKRDGEHLTSDEIASFLRSYAEHQVTDYQMSAFLMAAYLNGMNRDETFLFTRELRDSGTTLDLSSIPGRKIDKHSTGGVGDKTSLLIAPIVAACGVTVPMVTGRALGHTGGTLDKLQSIPGFNPYPSPTAIVNILKQSGAVIMGQTDDIAPLDRRLYALRDVSACVESIPLITASILSKKLAEGIDGLVMDVKTGSGAFMPTLKLAIKLARSIIDTGSRMKKKIAVVISDMDQPLGHAIGNALEVRECIDFLNGRAPNDLEDLTLTLCAHMIHMGGRARTLDRARKMAYEVVSKGEAAQRFRQIVQLQGGDERIMDNPDILPRARNVESFRATASGFVARTDAGLLGLASNALGAGRLRVDDAIDPAVGIFLDKKTGDRVKRGEILCRIHWNDRVRLRTALPLIQQAYDISTRMPSARPLIHAVFSG